VPLSLVSIPSLIATKAISSRSSVSMAFSINRASRMKRSSLDTATPLKQPFRASLSISWKAGLSSVDPVKPASTYSLEISDTSYGWYPAKSN